MRTYRVSARNKRPLLDFMVNALHECGCRTLFVSEPDEAPFRITFETSQGERMGILAYAFYANQRTTKNRPEDEHRFQVKYGSKRSDELHTLWQDPFGLYTTIFLGIDTESGFFVGADPVLHSPTRFFISIEFKHRDAKQILDRGWHAWERESRAGTEPVEVLVGGTASSFLRYVRLERYALGEAPGHRELLSERGAPSGLLYGAPPSNDLHRLAREFELPEKEVFDLIERAPRLKMAVRGWVAEEHLYRLLRQVPGVTKCERLEKDGAADIVLRYRNTPLTVECKNTLRKPTADGRIRLDLQRTRASKADPCSRYYSVADFDVVAACTHSVTETWSFRYAPTRDLDGHRRCEGKLDNNVKLDVRWAVSPDVALSAALVGRG